MDAVVWREWHEKTLKLARKQNKPIVLKIGAPWCHWCRVLEETTFKDARVRQTIAEDFIPISVDSDRRPDVNSRYNLGGWPTVAFLRPDGTLITGATFIPPDMMVRFLSDIKDHLAPDGKSAALTFPEVGVYRLEIKPSTPSMPLNDRILKHFHDLLVKHFDPVYGGFDGRPKFPMTQALALALALAAEKDRLSLRILDESLRKMAESALFDQLDGGFFRYSANRDWSEPHTEKLLADQAELALIYLDAFSLTGEPVFSEIAGRILDYLEKNLLKPFGRFCGSRQADEDYSRATPEERKTMAAPPIDETVFSGSNARAASAFIKADAVLCRANAADIALKTLNNLFNHMRARNGLFWHYSDDRTSGCLGLLGDQVNILLALLDAYEASANATFVTEAISLANVIANRLLDRHSGTFFDRLPGREEIGALKSPYQPIDLNARAAIAYSRLAGITGNDKFKQTARTALTGFSGDYKDLGLLSSEYGQAVDWLLSPVVEIFITGTRQAVVESELWKTARSVYHPRKILIVNGQRSIKPPPSALKETPSPAALIRVGDRRLEPISEPGEFRARLKEAA